MIVTIKIKQLQINQISTEWIVFNKSISLGLFDA